MDENQESVQEMHSQKSNGMNPLLILGVLAVVLIGGAVLLMGRNSSQNPSSSETTMEEKKMVPSSAMEETTGTSEVMSDDPNVQTITLEAGAFYYKPAEIKVKKGQKVKIVMHSVDMMHDFNIDELKVKLPITKSGETNTVEFTPDQTGTFEYYCSVGQHREKGQVGKITVEE